MAHFMFVGEDMAEMMDAVFRGDNKKVAELEEKFRLKEIRDKEHEYSRHKEKLTEEQFLAFTQIDSVLKRCGSYSWIMSKHVWQIKRLESYSDGGFYQRDIEIRMHNGKFDIYEYYCDETGYDQGIKMMHENINPSEIMSLIAKIQE